MKLFALVLILFGLGGCAFQTQLMARDNGKIYAGKLQGNGMGQGTLTVQIDNKTCSGTAVRTSSNDTFGIAQTYGSRPGIASFQSFGGTKTVKALLACSDGTGLRCDMEGSSSGAGGICADSNNRVYDLIATPG